jgi:hypothetical protein
MDEERTGRTRLKVAGIAAAAVLAVPGGMAISNAVASDGGAGSASPTAAPYAPAQDQAPPENGERPDRGGAPGDRGDCPGKDGDRRGGDESGTSTTGWTQS